MIQVILLEALRKSGVLTEAQIKNMATLNDLYYFLVSAGKIPPVSDEELEVCRKFDDVMKDSDLTFEKKLRRISRIADSIKDPVLKSVFDKVVEQGRKI